MYIYYNNSKHNIYHKCIYIYIYIINIQLYIIYMYIQNTVYHNIYLLYTFIIYIHIYTFILYIYIYHNIHSFCRLASRSSIYYVGRRRPELDDVEDGGRRWWWPLRRRWEIKRRRWRQTAALEMKTKELPDLGLLCIYIGADPLAPDRGWNWC